MAVLIFYTVMAAFCAMNKEKLFRHNLRNTECGHDRLVQRGRVLYGAPHTMTASCSSQGHRNGIWSLNHPDDDQLTVVHNLVNDATPFPGHW